jgi:hypothetical protein
VTRTENNVAGTTTSGRAAEELPESIGMSDVPVATGWEKKR